MSYKNPLIYIIPFLFIIFLFTSLIVKTEQHFVLLAKSFLSGSLALTQDFKNISDLSLFDGKYYWPLGPFPAVMLIPFVMLFKSFLQGYLSFPLTLLNFYLLYKIAKKMGLTKNKQFLLPVFFIFGTIYTSLALLPASWYFAQIVACTLLIIALYNFLHSRNYLLIGVLVALASATRFNLILSSVFFLYFLLKRPIQIKNLVKFSLPVIFIITLLGAYNQARFKTPFESGYNLQLIPEATRERRSIGLFSLAHIPSNLYYMLLNGPSPVLNEKTHMLKPPFVTFDSYGTSLFFISPLLIFLYKANYKKEIIKIAGLTCILMLIPIITYYGIGQKQVGYRYALDFFPFIFLLLADAIKKVRLKTIWVLAAFSLFVNFFFSFLYLFGLEH